MQKKRPAIGAAFAHARKVEVETGGGHKKQRAVAARYLKRKGMPAMAKAGGEGSRGGRVIGHTAQNHPIYASGAAKTDYSHFGAMDHLDAARSHLEISHQAIKNGDVALSKQHRMLASAHSAKGKQVHAKEMRQLAKPKPVPKSAQAKPAPKAAEQAPLATRSGAKVHLAHDAAHASYKKFSHTDHLDAAGHHLEHAQRAVSENRFDDAKKHLAISQGHSEKAKGIKIVLLRSPRKRTKASLEREDVLNEGKPTGRSDVAAAQPRRLQNSMMGKMRSVMTKAAEFVESEHPRAGDGEFSSGGGSGKAASSASVSRASRDKIMHSPAPHLLPKEADGLPPGPSPENSHAFALGSKGNPTTEERQAASKGKYGKTFTAKEKSALQAYSKEDGHTAYTNVNISVKAEAENKLADIEKTVHGRAYNQDMRHAARLINQAIAHSPLPEDKMLYRGGHIPESLGVGDIFCGPQFTSTSDSEGVAEFFTERLSGNRPLLKIQAHKGDKVFDYGKAFRDASEENEFLFGSFQRFYVVDIEKDEASGRKVVHLSTRPVAGQAKVVGKSMVKAERPGRPSKGLGLRLMGNMPAPAICKKKKTERVIKAMPGTLGAYQSAIAQSSAPGHLSDDDKYAMSRYQALFDKNHAAIAQARAEAFARMLAQRSR